MEIVAAIISVVRIRDLCGCEGRTCNENQVKSDASGSLAYLYDQIQRCPGLAAGR